MLGRRAGSRITPQKLTRELRKVLRQPGGHRFLLLKNALADALGLHIASLIGSGDEDFVGSNLYVLEAVARQGSLHDLVAYEQTTESLAQPRHFADDVLDSGCAAATAINALLNQV